MSRPSRFVLRIASLAILAAGCGSTSLTPPKHDSGTSGGDTAMTVPNDASDAQVTSTDSGTDAPGSGGCAGHGPAPSEVPPDHRPTAPACSVSAYSVALNGAGTCTGDADCRRAPFSSDGPTCLHGQCSTDRCLTDADCAPTEVCACASGSRLNSCVPAQCHVDADCGPGGYCSPSGAPCGGIGGYYCHGPNDTCVDAAKDCECGQFCQYTPTTGAFTCTSRTCAG